MKHKKILVAILSLFTLTANHAQIFEMAPTTNSQPVNPIIVDSPKEVKQEESVQDSSILLEDDGSEIILVQEEEVKKPLINPFIIAVQTKDYNRAEEYLQQGKSVDEALIDGNSMLLLAAMQKDVKLANLAFKYNANPQKANTRGDIALHWASATGSNQIVKALLSMPKNGINVKNKRGRNALHFTGLYRGTAQTVDMLVNSGIDIEAIDENGRTPLFYAASSRHWDVVEALLKNKADLYKKDNDGTTPENLIMEKADIFTKIKLYDYFSDIIKKQLADSKNFRR